MAHCQTGSLWVSTLFFSPLLPYCWSVSKSLRISCFLSPVVRFLHVVHLACKYGVCGAGLQGIYMYLFIFLKPCAGLSHIHGNQPLQSPFPGWVKLNKTHKTESTWDQLLWCPWITSKEKCGITWLEKTHDLKPQRNSYIQAHLLWNSPLVWGLLVAGVQCTTNGWLLP